MHFLPSIQIRRQRVAVDDLATHRKTVHGRIVVERHVPRGHHVFGNDPTESIFASGSSIRRTSGFKATSSSLIIYRIQSPKMLYPKRPGAVMVLPRNVGALSVVEIGWGFAYD
jgi:hypothetical protein